MTQLLISVKDVAEANIAMENGADIIDLKDPDSGALGALPISAIEAIINFVAGRKQTSATIGDFPMHPELIKNGIVRLQKFPLNFIKIGFFEADDYQSCLNEVKKLVTMHLQSTHQKLPQFIAVLFAENNYPEDLLIRIKQAGFSGVMLDTLNKNGKTYLDHYSESELEILRHAALSNNLAFGMAGSLQFKHIDSSLKLKPEFLGFRGGVCEDNLRQQPLSAKKICDINKFLQRVV